MVESGGRCGAGCGRHVVFGVEWSHGPSGRTDPWAGDSVTVCPVLPLPVVFAFFGRDYGKRSAACEGAVPVGLSELHRVIPPRLRAGRAAPGRGAAGSQGPRKRGGGEWLRKVVRRALLEDEDEAGGAPLSLVVKRAWMRADRGGVKTRKRALHVDEARPRMKRVTLSVGSIDLESPARVVRLQLVPQSRLVSLLLRTTYDAQCKEGECLSPFGAFLPPTIIPPLLRLLQYHALTSCDLSRSVREAGYWNGAGEGRRTEVQGRRAKARGCEKEWTELLFSIYPEYRCYRTRLPSATSLAFVFDGVDSPAGLPYKFWLLLRRMDSEATITDAGRFGSTRYCAFNFRNIPTSLLDTLQLCFKTMLDEPLGHRRSYFSRGVGLSNYRNSSRVLGTKPEIMFGDVTDLWLNFFLSVSFHFLSQDHQGSTDLEFQLHSVSLALTATFLSMSFRSTTADETLKAGAILAEVMASIMLDFNFVPVTHVRIYLD
ncbi:hypothetical protein C8R45DRAFT_1077358 [Mycena sanguinolenta]|nr:hypothetical protein C8R45DRAFT_1077358 [Mycena sanguinolenta]